LLGKGRLDESGDFTRGAGLDEEQIAQILTVILPDIGPIDGHASADRQRNYLDRLFAIISNSPTGDAGVRELQEIMGLVLDAGYGGKPPRIVVDPSVVRGLEYYTGPVFEAELLA